MMRNFLKLTTAAIVLASTPVFAQTDGTADDDIDWSLYEDLGFEDESMKRYANAKIEGLSPAKLISLATTSKVRIRLQQVTYNGRRNYSEGGDAMQVNSTAGIRAGFNLPVVSQNNLVWQMGANYWNTSYNYAEAPTSQITRCTNRFQSTDFVLLVSAQRSTSLWTTHSSSCSRVQQI